MKVYLVKHCYGTDGGYGDYISKEETVAIFENKDDAEKFVEKYSAKPEEIIYDTPYAELDCGVLEVGEIEIITHNDFDINKTPFDYGCYLPYLYNKDDEVSKEFYRKWNGEK